MTSNIQNAVKDGKRAVWLADVQRGEKGLTCYTCGDKMTVKDGGGQFVNGEGRRNRSKGKHFSHTANSRCHGEGPAHYRLKTALCYAINSTLELPADTRNMHGTIQYRCPDQEYGPHDIFKVAPPTDFRTRSFPEMEHGFHIYDLLRQPFDRAECEVRLGKGKTRADIVGLDADSKVLWVIEIKRTTLTRAATKNAENEGYPLFVVDITKLPQGTDNDPWAEVKAMEYNIIAENLCRGFYPQAAESRNVKCERKAFGMGPTDTTWKKEYVFVCQGETDCGSNSCPDCEEVLLHQCGGDKDAMICPDVAYMFQHGITPVEMYTNPVHMARSHTWAGQHG